MQSRCRSEGEEDAGEEEDERVDDARRKEMLELADRLVDAEALLHDGVYPREFLYLCFDKVKVSDEYNRIKWGCMNDCS